jgi:hypothetical protein
MGAGRRSAYFALLWIALWKFTWLGVSYFAPRDYILYA